MLTGRDDPTAAYAALRQDDPCRCASPNWRASAVRLRSSDAGAGADATSCAHHCGVRGGLCQHTAVQRQPLAADTVPACRHAACRAQTPPAAPPTRAAPAGRAHAARAPRRRSPAPAGRRCRDGGWPAHRRHQWRRPAVHWRTPRAPTPACCRCSDSGCRCRWHRSDARSGPAARGRRTSRAAAAVPAPAPSGALPLNRCRPAPARRRDARPECAGTHATCRRRCTARRGCASTPGVA